MKVIKIGLCRKMRLLLLMFQFLLLNDTSDKAVVGHTLLHATKQGDNLSDTCNILFSCKTVSHSMTINSVIIEKLSNFIYLQFFFRKLKIVMIRHIQFMQKCSFAF